MGAPPEKHAFVAALAPDRTSRPDALVSSGGCRAYGLAGLRFPWPGDSPASVVQRRSCVVGEFGVGWDRVGLRDTRDGVSN